VFLQLEIEFDGQNATLSAEILAYQYSQIKKRRELQEKLAMTK
jgi:hypothetical protein